MKMQAICHCVKGAITGVIVNVLEFCPLSVAKGYPYICPFCIKSTFTKIISMVSSISSSIQAVKDQLASLEMKLSELEEVPLANEFEALKNTVKEISCKLEIKEVNTTADANQSSAPIQPQKQSSNKS